MAFDERDYLKDSHTRSNEKNLEIYNPKEFRRDRHSDPHQYRTSQYDEIRGYKPYTTEQIFALVLIALALAWIAFASWKILHG